MGIAYLHAGMHKTGTSALQYFLGANRETLKKFKICYPDMGLSYPDVGKYRNGHFLAVSYTDAQDGFGNARPRSEYESALQNLETLAQEYDTIILSEENLWRDIWNRPDHYKRVKDDFAKCGLQIRVIVYLRRQDTWIESFWAQKVKENDTRGLMQFIEERRKHVPLDYYACVGRMAEIFGADSLIIRIYEEDKYRSGEYALHQDFLSILGLSLEDGFIRTQEIQNTSLIGGSVEIKRILNRLPQFCSSRHPIVREMRDVQELLREPAARGSYFDPQTRRAFMRGFEESNEKLAREVLGKEDGVLFSEAGGELPVLGKNDRELLETVILVYGRQIDGLKKEIEKLKERKNRRFFRFLRRLSARWKAAVRQ